MRLLLVISLLVVLNGSASMLNQNQDRAEVFGPSEMTATDDYGNKLGIFHDEKERFILLPKFDTFVTFHYGKASERVLLQRSFSGWTLLNIESLGIGFVFDDAIGGWRAYDPIYVHLDSNGGIDSSLGMNSASNSSSKDRPYFLVQGGWGIPGTYSTNSQSWGPFDLEWGIGFDYAHKIDVFYRSSTEYNTGFTPNTSIEYDGDTYVQAFLLRYYAWNGFFVEGGPSSITLSTDSAFDYIDYTPGKFFAPETASFGAITTGVGWSGDFSYIEAHYDYGLKIYQFFDQPALHFHELVVSLGLIFRM
jgi:hypothetical protein